MTREYLTIVYRADNIPPGTLTGDPRIAAMSWTHALQDRDKARTEIERLRAIVDRLPRTADGVPVWAGMDVWLNDDPCGVRCCCVQEVWLLADRSHVYLTFHGVSDGPRQFSELFSTREAAEAAGREGG